MNKIIVGTVIFVIAFLLLCFFIQTSESEPATPRVAYEKQENTSLPQNNHRLEPPTAEEELELLKSLGIKKYEVYNPETGELAYFDTIEDAKLHASPIETISIYPGFEEE